MMGVDSTDINNRAKAANSNTASGVAGLNMMAAYSRRHWSDRYWKPTSSRRGDVVVGVARRVETPYLVPCPELIN